MPAREIDWGGANSPYTTHVDKDGNGRVVLAEDTDGNTVLLEYDESAGEWIYGGPVNMSGSDISNVGEVDATAVSTDELRGDVVDRSEAITSISGNIETGSQVPAEGTPGDVFVKTDPYRGSVTANLSGNQTISSSSLFTNVEFDGTLGSGDELDGFDSSDNRFYAPIDGWYLVSAHLRWDGTFSGDDDGVIMRLEGGFGVNNPTSKAAFSDTVSAPTMPPIVRTLWLDEGDTVRLRIRQDSGGDVDIRSDSGYTWLSVTRVV